MLEFLTFAARIRGVKQDVAKAVQDAMQMTDLESVPNRRIATLSHGFQKRLGIAQAIVHRPTLILLDEPTSGLDPVQVVHMRTLLRSLRNKHTILLSSHILSEIHQVCDRLLVLQQGHIVAQGSEEELAQKLQRHVTIQIEVRGAKEALEQALAKVTELTHVTLTSESSELHGALLESSVDCREAIALALVQQGLGLRKLQRVEVELENIFLQLTSTENKQAA